MKIRSSRRGSASVTESRQSLEGPDYFASDSNSIQNEDLNFGTMFGVGSLPLSSDNEDQALPMFGLSELALGVVDDDDNDDFEDFADDDEGDFAHQPAKKKRIRHPPREPVICEVCNKQFTRKAHLVRHMYLHTGEKPFKCNQCPQSFNRKDHLRSHMRGHVEAKQFKCNQCTCSFSRVDHLRVHVLKNHGKYQKSLKSGAGTTTSSASTPGGSGQQAASMPKLGFKVLTCRYCNMKFSQTHAYNSHIAAHKRGEVAGSENANDTNSNDDCENENGTDIKLPQNIDIMKTLNAYVCIDSAERDLAEMHVETAVSNDEGEEEEEQSGEGDEGGENEQSDQNSRDDQQEEETGDDDEDDTNNEGVNEDDESSQGMFGEKQEPPKKLECVVCGKDNFSDQRALRRHYKVHKRRFICRFCGIKMSSAGSLMRHNMLHTGEKPFECDKCNRKFSRKDALKAHLVAHEKDSVKHTLPRPFVCTKCPASYTMRYNLIRHMRQCHQSQARNRNSATTRAIQRQQPQEVPPQLIDEQGEEGQSRTPIQIDPKNPLKCMHCNKVFASMKSLSTHVWYHNQEKRFTCKVCNRAFKYATDLNRHLMTHNVGRKVISLTQQRANNRLALAKQQNQGTAAFRAAPNHNSIMVNGQRRYPCEFCTVIFNHRSNRSRHVRIFHSNQQQNRASVPQQQQQQRQQFQSQRQISFAARERLKRAGVSAVAFHRRRVQPVSRNQLNLKANQAAALMRAQQLQIRQARISIESNDAEEVQPNYNGLFKCDLCDKIFDKRYNYKLHLRTHNKQFSCIVCGLKTASQGDLTLHIRTHTGEKPFQCSYPNCEWKFARRSALTVHYRRHHGPNSKIKRQYNPQRVTPNMMNVDPSTAAKLVETVDNTSQDGNQDNSILKTMLENYPCKSDTIEDGNTGGANDESQPSVKQQTKPKKNLPPPPPLLRYPVSPAMLQKKDDSKDMSEQEEDIIAPEVVFLCKPCGQLISGKDNYVDHMLEQHGTTVTAIGSTPVTRPPNKQPINQLVQRKPAPPLLLRRPIQKQQQQQPGFTCQRCGERFESRHDMTVHNLVNHSSDSAQVMCGICRKLCSTIGFLSRHYQYCHPQAKNAAEEARIIIANNVEHHEEMDFDDSLQNDGGSAADSLLFPEVVIKEEFEEGGHTTGDNDGSEGDLSFTPTDLLETSTMSPPSSHKPTHASTSSNLPPDPNLPFLCPLCNKGFKDKKALADHKWYHSREAIYPCTVAGCEKRFKLKNDLIRHMRRHLQERPHACPEPGCESRFYQKSDLSRHLNKIHNQVESASHSCQHCSAGFTRPDLLVRHMKSSHPGQDVSHLLLLQMIDQKKQAEEKQMKEFLANLPPEEEEEVIEPEPEWSQDHDLDYSFELQQLEIDAFDNEDDLAYRESLSPTQRSKAQHASKVQQLQQGGGQSTLMEKLANENGALESGPPFTCQTCNKVYDDRQKFIYHRYYHVREFRYTCPVEGCGDKFKIKGHVERHIRTYHNSDRPVKNILHCPVQGCTRKFTRDYDLSNHLEKMHRSSKPPAVAATKEANYDELVQDMLEFEDANQEEDQSVTHDNEQKFSQNEDQQQEEDQEANSPSTSLLQPCMNKLEEYTNERGELYCKACNKHFKDLKTLQNHVYYHQREPKYHCEECGAKFKQRSDLRRHMGIHHDPNKKRQCIPCPQCKRSFTHERYLRIHLNKECDGAPKDEPVDDDGQNEGEYLTMNPQVEMEELSTDDQQLQQQQEIWDGDEPPNPLMFVSSDLQGEEDDYGEEEDEGYDKGHHTQMQPVFECDLCDTFFSRSNELILHKRSAHAASLSSQSSSTSPPSTSAGKGKVKTFSCNKCGMSFLQKGELTQHLQQYHLDELPIHQCQFCPKYFYVKKSLDTHRRRHHSHLLNLIACQICGMKFQAKEYLVSHMKSHHQIN